jgi:DNA polymerase
MKPILLDFESRSRVDLTVVGGRNYWAHPSAQALCCSWHDLETGERGTWLPGEPCPLDPSRDWAAHNAMGFDRFGTLRTWGLSPARWIDTSELARRAGLPGSLDALAKRWTGLAKDKVASGFTKRLSSVRRPPHVTVADWRDMPDRERRLRGELPALTDDTLETVVSYCESDVAIMADGWPKLEEWHGLEDDVEQADRAVNERGFRFDVALAKRLLECDAELAKQALQTAAEAMWSTPAEVRAIVQSPKQFCAAVGTLDARKNTIAGIDHPLVAARQALASIARGKLEAGLAVVSADGRIRDTLRYYGATTGRWAGRYYQPHNLPRPSKRLEDLDSDGVCELADRVLGGYLPEQDEIAVLLRGCITADEGHTLVVQDFSGVEARALAWCAGDEGALEVFASGRNPYITAAAAIYGRPYESIHKGSAEYTIGKIAELALGYQGGHMAFSKMAATYGLNLADVNVPLVVKAWRRAHAPTVRFWAELQTAFVDAITLGRSSCVGPFEIVPGEGADASDVAILLPSGRPLVYRQASCAGHELRFVGVKGEEYTYGGKLAENAIQALCRDLMAGALVRAEAAGLRPVLHVHDEIVCEVPICTAELDAQRLHATMIELPAWADGFPIGAAGHIGRRYRK